MIDSGGSSDGRVVAVQGRGGFRLGFIAREEPASVFWLEPAASSRFAHCYEAAGKRTPFLASSECLLRDSVDATPDTESTPGPWKKRFSITSHEFEALTQLANTTQHAAHRTTVSGAAPTPKRRRIDRELDEDDLEMLKELDSGSSDRTDSMCNESLEGLQSDRDDELSDAVDSEPGSPAGDQQVPAPPAVSIVPHAHLRELARRLEGRVVVYSVKLGSGVSGAWTRHAGTITKAHGEGTGFQIVLSARHNHLGVVPHAGPDAPFPFPSLGYVYSSVAAAGADSACNEAEQKRPGRLSSSDSSGDLIIHSKRREDKQSKKKKKKKKKKKADKKAKKDKKEKKTSHKKEKRAVPSSHSTTHEQSDNPDVIVIDSSDDDAPLDRAVREYASMSSIYLTERVLKVHAEWNHRRNHVGGRKQRFIDYISFQRNWAASESLPHVPALISVTPREVVTAALACGQVRVAHQSSSAHGVRVVGAVSAAEATQQKLKERLAMRERARRAADGVVAGDRQQPVQIATSTRTPLPPGSLTRHRFTCKTAVAAALNVLAATAAQPPPR